MLLVKKTGVAAVNRIGRGIEFLLRKDYRLLGGMNRVLVVAEQTFQHRHMQPILRHVRKHFVGRNGDVVSVLSALEQMVAPAEIEHDLGALTRLQISAEQGAAITSHSRFQFLQVKVVI